MKKAIVVAIAAGSLLSLFFALSAYSEQQTSNKEELVLTTYYPTPYGDYREMRAERMAVGQNWRSAANVCWEQGKCTDWINEEGTGGDTDLIVEGNVGIGNTYQPQTAVPNAKQGNLDVNDVWVRSLDNNTGQWISQMSSPENYILVVDQRPAGTGGGATSSATVHTRVLNTIKNNIPFHPVSLTANRLRFSKGTYRCHIMPPAFSTQHTVAWLQNVTKNSTILVGTNTFGHGSYPNTVFSRIIGVFSVGDGQAVEPNDELEVQQYIVAGHGQGFGIPVGFAGLPEIYTTVECFRTDN